MSEPTCPHNGCPLPPDMLCQARACREHCGDHCPGGCPARMAVLIDAAREVELPDTDLYDDPGPVVVDDSEV